MPKLSFGKHSGLDLQDVPRDYLEWLRDSRARDLAEYEAELRRRDLVEEGNLSIGERIVIAGYRELSKKLHPDAGGSTRDFQDLQASYEQLKVILREAKAIT